MDSARIALAMVGRSSTSFEVTKHWIEVLRRRHWPGPTFHMPEIYAAGHWSGVCPLRNLLTYRALQEDSWDYMLWMDADHIPQVDLFDRVEEHARNEVGIVGGLYYARTYPFEVQAIGVGPDGERSLGKLRPIESTALVPLLWPPQSALMLVAGVGTGCMLIRRDVIERIAVRRGSGDVWHVDKIPWEEQIRLLSEPGADISGVMTEDFLFCVDAAELLGVDTFLDLDPRMETGHEGAEIRGRRHYLAAHTVPPGVDPTQIKLPAGYATAPVNTTRENARRQRRLNG